MKVETADEEAPWWCDGSWMQPFHGTNGDVLGCRISTGQCDVVMPENPVRYGSCPTSRCPAKNSSDTHPGGGTGSIDYARCNGGSFAFFEADPGTAHVEIPGILERWWVVDLDGTPVIVGTAAGPKATPAQADAIKAIAEAAEFASR